MQQGAPPPKPELTQQKKQEIRRFTRSKRRELPDAERVRYDQQLNLHLQQRLLELQPCWVSVFLAFDGEPDLSPTVQALLQEGFRIALPVIESRSGHSEMIFRSWQHDEPLSDNAFGIAEPSQGRLVSIEEIGIMLIPLVAWDTSGGRLGMGAGYYDRALAAFRQRDKPLRIGVAYELQRVEYIPIQEHDVRLHEIITEKQRFTFPA